MAQVAKALRRNLDEVARLYAWRKERDEKAGIQSCEMQTCLRLNVPDWFKRKDFNAWRKKWMTDPRPLATWHNPKEPDTNPREFSDLFISFDAIAGPAIYWEGSDSDDLPLDIFTAIAQKIDELPQNKRCGVIWLSNLEDWA